MNRVSGIGAMCVALVLSMLVPVHRLFANPPLTVKASNNNITVLQPADKLPSDARQLKSLVINGDNPTADCSYMEILESAKKMAADMGANIVKVTKHVARSNAKNCDQVTAEFYKASDADHIASEMKWTEGKRLSWSDFRGEMPRAAHEETAAATYCGIGFETNTISETDVPKIFVYNTFYANQSWVRPDEQKAEILGHEQGHFDICELYTRKLREQISEAHIDYHNLRSALSAIYKSVNSDYEKRQQAYEDETEHGLVAEQQQKWQQTIAQELQQTKQWKE